MDEAEPRTIAMTGRTPVRIVDAEWPIIAEAFDDHECGQAAQNGEVNWALRVRGHENGRRIVYGETHGSCQCQGGYSPEPNPGELVVAGGDIAEAIRRVAQSLLAGRWPSDTEADDRRAVTALISQCLSRFPAETL